MEKIIYPHSHTNARLGLSKIHGIGVFAIRDIPENKNIFPDDKTNIVWVPQEEISGLNLPNAILKLYTDFCIYKDNKYGIPENFNSITPGWYMNEPVKDTDENVYVDENYNFYAKRNITAGEELLVKYNNFSEELHRY